MRCLALLLLCAVADAALAETTAVAATPVGVAQALVAPRLSSGPARVLVERLPDRQDLNFEIFVHNAGPVALTLAGIELSARDAQGRLLLRRVIDGNGVRPSIQTLPERAVAAGQSLTVFNPFASFDAALPLARLDYLLRFTDADGGTVEAALSVHPQSWQPRAALRLPVRGRMINYDGHDYLAHHRRFDYSFAPIAQLGFKSNFMRYAYDFVPVDSMGRMHLGDGKANASYFGFGAALRATADGTVVAVVNGRPDDRQFDQGQLATNPMVLFGNYLVIDHGHGEFSLYAHLQQHSVLPAPGQRVRQGEPVARIGASGSAMFPHLHYELRDGPDFRAEGLPSYFERFRRWNGAEAVVRQRATVDTGEIVEADD